jgi:hypothetical protein
MTSGNKNIYEKIKNRLNLGYEFNESEAVHFLILFYKLIEDNKKEFPAIVFYRNWCMHAKLSREQHLVEKTIEGTANWINEIRKREELGKNEYVDMNFYNKYYFWNSLPLGLVSFVELKSELEKQIAHISKKFKFEHNDGWWTSFKLSIISTVENTPLFIGIEDCPIKKITVGFIREVGYFEKNIFNPNSSFFVRSLYDDGYEDEWIIKLNIKNTQLFK